MVTGPLGARPANACVIVAREFLLNPGSSRIAGVLPQRRHVNANSAELNEAPGKRSFREDRCSKIERAEVSEHRSARR